MDRVIKYFVVPLAVGFSLSCIVAFSFVKPNSKSIVHGQVYMIIPGGKFKFSNYVGEISREKTLNVWVDDKGAKHLTSGAVEFVEDKK